MAYNYLQFEQPIAELEAKLAELKAEQKEGYILLNPGSVSIPKEGNPPTYAVLEDKTFTIKDFDGNIIKEMRLG